MKWNGSTNTLQKSSRKTNREFDGRYVPESSLTATQSVPELFKTPGKLRGKTPRTARRNGQEHRAVRPMKPTCRAPQLIGLQPLTEILSTDLRYNASPARSIFSMSPTKQTTPSCATGKKTHTESPSKGIVANLQPTEEEHDEMEVDAPIGGDQEPQANQEPQREEMEVDKPSEHAFTENDTSKETHAISHAASDSAASIISVARTSEPNHTTATTRPSPIILSPGKEQETGKSTMAAVQNATGENESMLEVDDHSLEGSESSSEQSSPGKGLVRKSSLTFASLPARDPIPTKKSIGNLASRASNAEAPKATGLNRNSYLDRLTGGKSMGAYRQINDDQMDVDEEETAATNKDESDGDSKMTKLHNKSSTQRLHERINMLGKTQAPRPTKSIPAAAAPIQPTYPEIPKTSIGDVSKEHPINAEKQSVMKAGVDDDDEDWIKPLPKQTKPASRPEMSKSRSVDVMEQIAGKTSISQNIQDNGYPEQTFMQKGSEGSRSPAPSRQAAAIAPPSPTTKSPRFFHKKPISVSNPSLPPAASTTPSGSPPSKHNLDGHISASKSKLQSIMKSARGLFSSSARVSTQAKLETLSPSTRARQIQATSLNEIVESIKGNPAGERKVPPPVPAKEPVGKGIVDEPRRLRSSTEKQKISREQERKEEMQVEVAKQEHERKNDERLRQIESSKPVAEIKSVEIPSQPTRPTRQSPRRPQNPRVPSVAESNTSQSTAQSRSTVTTTQSQRGKELRRPMKPAKETAPKQKPQPVSIRVGTLSQRVPLTNANLASSLQESLAPAPARPAGPVKKASNSTLHPSASTTSLNRSVSATNSKPKALLAAERKKEQDEREAQRKLEHKKEIERKRAAAQEEARKREIQQRQEAEKQKEKERAAAAAAEDTKRQAQRAAIEKRRLELGKKEQQIDPRRAINELVSDDMGQDLEPYLTIAGSVPSPRGPSASGEQPARAWSRCQAAIQAGTTSDGLSSRERCSAKASVRPRSGRRACGSSSDADPRLPTEPSEAKAHFGRAESGTSDPSYHGASHSSLEHPQGKNPPIVECRWR